MSLQPSVRLVVPQASSRVLWWKTSYVVMNYQRTNELTYVVKEEHLPFVTRRRLRNQPPLVNQGTVLALKVPELAGNVNYCPTAVCGIHAPKTFRYQEQELDRLTMLESDSQTAPCQGRLARSDTALLVILEVSMHQHAQLMFPSESYSTKTRSVSGEEWVCSGSSVYRAYEPPSCVSGPTS